MPPLLLDKSLPFLVNILDAFIRVSNYLGTIILQLHQYYSTRLYDNVIKIVKEMKKIKVKY